jgi:uncharacterized protein YbbK (DUF523 family)
VDNTDSLVSKDDNTESPTTYGKEAYKKYRRNEKLKEESGTLGGNYSQKRTKIVMDAHYAAIMAQLLKGLKFPKNKAEIIQFILQNRSPSISRTQTTDVLSLIQQVQEREYKTVADLTDAVGLLRDLT